MKIETFELERFQSLYENEVSFNLTESGVHPYKLNELLSAEQLAVLMDTRLTYGQTNGLPQLRELIAGLYEDTHLHDVLVTNGSSEANFIANWNLLEPGDEIAYMLPNYMQIWGLVRAMGVKVKTFQLLPDKNWAPDLEQLRQVVTSKTRMITLCNPNNPTGAVLDKAAMQAIVNIAAEVDAWIYVDEVYRGAELNGAETPSFRGMYEKVIVAGGLSKAYALPGLRLGWLAGPRSLMDAAWATSDYTSITAGILSNLTAIHALQSPTRESILERNRTMLRTNLEVLQQWIESHQGLFQLTPPAAGGMAFLRYNLPMNSRDFCEQLRLEEGVFLCAGDWYHMEHYLRIGIGSEKEFLQAGLARIDRFLKTRI